MKKYFLPCLLVAAALAACNQTSEAAPPTLNDQQIVCTLKGEAFIFIEGYEKTVHSVRSLESDPLCAPLKQNVPPAAPVKAASQ